MPNPLLHLEGADTVGPALRMGRVRLDNGSDSRAGVWGETNPAVNAAAVVAEIRKATWSVRGGGALPDGSIGTGLGRPGAAIHIGAIGYRCTNIKDGFTSTAAMVHGLLTGCFPCGMEIEYARAFLAPLIPLRSKIRLAYCDVENYPNLDNPAAWPGVYEGWKAARTLMGEPCGPLDYQRDSRQAMVGACRLIVAACGLDPDVLAMWGCSSVAVANGWGGNDSINGPVNIAGSRPHFTATTPDHATTMRLARWLAACANPARAVVHLSAGDANAGWVVPPAMNAERWRICTALGCGDVIGYCSDANAAQVRGFVEACGGGN